MLIALASAGALLLGALAGCGGSSTSTSSSTNSGTTADRAPYKGSEATPSLGSEATPSHGSPKRTGAKQAEDVPHHAGKGNDRSGKSAPGNSSGAGESATAGANQGKAPATKSSAGAKQTPAATPAAGPKPAKSQDQAGKGSSKCGSKERCAQIQVHEAEQSGGATPTPATTCPTGMSTTECEAIGKAIQEGGGTVTTTVGCPAAMSEAECQQVGEAYEAATK